MLDVLIELCVDFGQWAYYVVLFLLRLCTLLSFAPFAPFRTRDLLRGHHSRLLALFLWQVFDQDSLKQFENSNKVEYWASCASIFRFNWTLSSSFFASFSFEAVKWKIWPSSSLPMKIRRQILSTTNDFSIIKLSMIVTFSAKAFSTTPSFCLTSSTASAFFSSCSRRSMMLVLFVSNVANFSFNLKQSKSRFSHSTKTITASPTFAESLHSAFAKLPFSRLIFSVSVFEWWEATTKTIITSSRAANWLPKLV